MNIVYLLIIFSHYGDAAELSPKYESQQECQDAGNYLNGQSSRMRDFACLPVKANP